MTQLVIRYDVTGLSEDEIAVLAGEAQAQAESSDADEWSVGHPDVPVVSVEVVETPGGKED